MSHSPCSQERLGKLTQAARLLTLAILRCWLRARNSFNKHTDQSAARRSGGPFLPATVPGDSCPASILHQSPPLHSPVS